jgi:hypothetical protein
MNELNEIKSYELKIQELRNGLPKYVIFFLNWKDSGNAEINDVVFDITQKQYWENAFADEHFLTDLNIGDYVYSNYAVFVRIK